jgi:hypothetical protein
MTLTFGERSTSGSLSQSGRDTEVGGGDHRPTTSCTARPDATTDQPEPSEFKDDSFERSMAGKPLTRKQYEVLEEPHDTTNFDPDGWGAENSNL